MRIALMVEYDGSQFYGWQSQTGLRTVQCVLEHALTQFATQKISVICAGRTDTGVHATGQIIHFDSMIERSARAWVNGTNAFLPKDVCIKWAHEVSCEFHARFSALSRRYVYIIYNTPTRSTLLRSNLAWQYKPLDHNMMHEASQCLLGQHDFSSFRSTECQAKTAIRTISDLKISRHGYVVVIDICANAFLHHMVRNIAGVLIAVGSGRESVAWVGQVLLAKNRSLGAQTAPPYGLYLICATYPEEFKIPRVISNPLAILGVI